MILFFLKTCVYYLGKKGQCTADDIRCKLLFFPLFVLYNCHTYPREYDFDYLQSFVLLTLKVVQ